MGMRNETKCILRTRVFKKGSHPRKTQRTVYNVTMDTSECMQCLLLYLACPDVFLGNVCEDHTQAMLDGTKSRLEADGIHCTCGGSSHADVSDMPS